MSTPFSELEQRLREGLVQFLWDQWVSIGMAGGATAGKIPFVVDPEALILATTRFGRADVRLHAESRDWLAANGNSISIQRLKNQQLNFQYGDVSELLGLAYSQTQSGHKNWKSLSTLEPELFQTSAAEFLSLFKEESQRGLSRKPDPRSSQAFLFKMRSFFGMNARAEVFTWLLAHDSGHAAVIARETAWFSKTVQVVLNELSHSGMVFAQSGQREKIFRLNHSDWNVLLPKDSSLGWFCQGPFYLGCTHVLHTLAVLSEASGASSRFQAIKTRERLTSTAAAFRMAGMGKFFSQGDGLSGDDLVEFFREQTEALLDILVRSRAFSPIACA